MDRKYTLQKFHMDKKARSFNIAGDRRIAKQFKRNIIGKNAINVIKYFLSKIELNNHAQYKHDNPETLYFSEKDFFSKVKKTK